MANYIKRLQAENADLRRRLDAVDKWRQELHAHLSSPKFHDDSTIQVKDVDARLYTLLCIRQGFENELDAYAPLHDADERCVLQHDAGLDGWTDCRDFGPPRTRAEAETEMLGRLDECRRAGIARRYRIRTVEA
jgi:hypothetical protein